MIRQCNIFFKKASCICPRKIYWIPAILGLLALTRAIVNYSYYTTDGGHDSNRQHDTVALKDIKYRHQDVLLNVETPVSLRPNQLDISNVWKSVTAIWDEWDPLVYYKEHKEDIRLAANLSNSVIYISNPKDEYKLAEDIRVRINLYDDYGHQKRAGGDVLRVRLFEDRADVKAGAACQVIDNHNGSYNALCKALWVGRPTISVRLVYNREVSLGIANAFNQMCGFAYLNCTRSSGRVELTLCFSEPVVEGYQKLCNNIPALKVKSPWYCGNPLKNPGIKKAYCQDGNTIKSRIAFLNSTYTSSEKRLLAKTIDETPSKLKITVTHGSQRQYSNLSCRDVPIENLWTIPSPTGHFYNNQWISSQCKLQKSASILRRCLQGYDIYLFGDSTTRQFVNGFVRILDCKINSEIRNKDGAKNEEKVVEETIALCPGHFIVKWLPHEAPNYRFGKSIDWYIDDIRKQRKHSPSALLIHMYVHLAEKHPTVFIYRMLRIRDSLERLLESNPNTIVLIKGPHTFWLPDSSFGYKNDNILTLYKTVLLQMFQGLRDKVRFLDIADMTMALGTSDMHPKPKIVDELVLYMLSFVCK